MWYIKKTYNCENVTYLFAIFRSESEASSPALSEPAPLLSDNELSPDCIDSSEPKKNIENDPPTYVPTPRYSNIQDNVGSTVVTTWSK